MTRNTNQTPQSKRPNKKRATTPLHYNTPRHKAITHSYLALSKEPERKKKGGEKEQLSSARARARAEWLFVGLYPNERSSHFRSRRRAMTLLSSAARCALLFLPPLFPPRVLRLLSLVAQRETERDPIALARASEIRVPIARRLINNDTPRQRSSNTPPFFTACYVCTFVCWVCISVRTMSWSIFVYVDHVYAYRFRREQGQYA